MAKRKPDVRKRSTTPPALLVPRHIRIINQIAETAGIRVAVSEAMADERRELVCLWEGTKRQLRSTGLLNLSYHFPVEVGWFGIPNTTPSMDRHILAEFISGRITVQSSRFTLRSTSCEVPDSIEERDGVEISSFADRVVAHGSADALIGAGICTAEEIPGPKRRSVRFNVDWRLDTWRLDSKAAIRWVTLRVPDGSYVHFREKEHVAKAREEAALAGKEKVKPQRKEDDSLTQEVWRKRISMVASGLFEVILGDAAGGIEEAQSPQFWLHTDARQRLMELRGTVLAVIGNAEIMTAPTPGPRPSIRGRPRLVLVTDNCRPTSTPAP